MCVWLCVRRSFPILCKSVLDKDKWTDPWSNRLSHTMLIFVPEASGERTFQSSIRFTIADVCTEILICGMPRQASLPQLVWSQFRSDRLTLSQSSSNVQSAMVPHALLRRTFLLCTFRTRGRVTVEKVQRAHHMTLEDYIIHIQSNYISAAESAWNLTYCHFVWKPSHQTSCLVLLLHQARWSCVSHRTRGQIVIHNDWFFGFYLWIGFLQEVEFSSRGSVPFTVIYSRIQPKSLAIFLHVSDKTGPFKTKGHSSTATC